MAGKGPLGSITLEVGASSRMGEANCYPARPIKAEPIEMARGHSQNTCSLVRGIPRFHFGRNMREVRLLIDNRHAASCEWVASIREGSKARDCICQPFLHKRGKKEKKSRIHRNDQRTVAAHLLVDKRYSSLLLWAKHEKNPASHLQSARILLQKRIK